MDRRVQCFKCTETFLDPNALFTHIKDVHRICGKSQYICTCTCTEIFSQFGAYKTHVKTCFNKIVVDDVAAVADRTELIECYNAVAMEDEDVRNFRESVDEKAFQLACKLNAIMILPRDLVYRTIKDFREFLQTVVDGMNKRVIPRLVGPEKRTVKEFVNVIGSSFSNLTTEWKFDKKLIEADLIAPMDRCAMFTDRLCDPKAPYDVEDLENVGCENETAILMPISFQIKKFLELPGVFRTMIDNAENIRREGKLNHFINGSLWKEKMKNFDENQIVIPYHYFSDGAQLNNPLGPHIRKGSEDFQYYSFPTIPHQYQSRLENIFLSYLFPEKFYSEFGLDEIFGNLIEELTKMATDGIIVNVDGTEHQVFLVCGCCLADNKEANIVGGFARGFNANKYCRFCRLDMSEMKKSTTENLATRRNRVNYDEDVTMHNLRETGVHEYSPLNKIPLFHVTESSSEDLSHTVEEGIVKYNIAGALSILIYEDKEITLEELNRRMKEFSYGEEEKQNRPHEISDEHLEKDKIKVTAAESANFIQNLPFMIGDLIPENNAAWQLILNTVKFFDFSYLPCYEEEDIVEWRKNIDEMHTQYIEICNEYLKPHHHFATHFPSDTKKFGPLRYTRTIRNEGRHRQSKEYAKNSNNRMNVSYSIGKKSQYNFAERILQSRGFEDIIEANYKPGKLKQKVYYDKLQSSIHKDRLGLQHCHFTNKVNINGMQINVGMWIPDVSDDGNRQIRKIHEICDIVLLSPKDINDFFVICKTYDATPNEHFAGYTIDMSSLHSKLSIVNVSDFLKKHHYPVQAHKIGSRVMFRCKRF